MITSKRAPGYNVSVGADLTQQTANIPTGGTGLSAAIDLGTEILQGYIMPATWVAAGLTFQTSPDGVAYNNIYDATGTEVAHVVDISRFVRVNPADWVGVRFIKLRSGTAAVPVNQTASRDIILVTNYAVSKGKNACPRQFQPRR
jgi:hypothetical protein